MYDSGFLKIQCYVFSLGHNQESFFFFFKEKQTSFYGSILGRFVFIEYIIKLQYLKKNDTSI